MFSQATPVVRNLLIINVIFYVVTHMVAPELQKSLAGYYPSAPQFQPWQIVTHMFMHASLGHIFFNMFALYMFGSQLERVWGPKRFLNYYLICGLGAFVLHELVVGYGLFTRYGSWFPNVQELYPGSGYSELQNVAKNMYVPVVGASGAVFGLLLGFGMLFPETRLQLLFPPVPIKARYFVMGYGAIELYMALQNSEGDNVAHFAHLGGMFFGYLLLKKWARDRDVFY